MPDSFVDRLPSQERELQEEWQRNELLRHMSPATHISKQMPVLAAVEVCVRTDGRD